MHLQRSSASAFSFYERTEECFIAVELCGEAMPVAEGINPAILYAAKSTEDKHGSIPTQLDDGRALAEQEGLEVVAAYKDKNASAYKGNRGPELAAALEHAERIGPR